MTVFEIRDKARESSLLGYLQKTDIERYRAIVEKLGLRR